MSCHDYGIVHGCDEGCPVLWDGRCEVPEEVIEGIASALEPEDLADLQDIYRVKPREYESIW